MAAKKPKKKPAGKRSPGDKKPAPAKDVKDVPGQLVIPGCEESFDIQLRMFARDCWLSQEGAAMILGISRSAVSQLAWSDRKPSGAVARVLKLARMILALDLDAGRTFDEFRRRFLPVEKRMSYRTGKETCEVVGRYTETDSAWSLAWWVKKRTAWREKSTSKELPR